jgi:hypothetical protein
MKEPIHISRVLPRLAMFAAMLGLLIYATHFILPVPSESSIDAVALDPLVQIGLFLALTILGGLVGFWITFGDLLDQPANK